MSNDFSAEYAGIANIRITTKRSGAGYHGSVIYNNKNSAFAAWTHQDKNGAANFAPTASQNQYPYPFFNITDLGGSFGGPVPKVKKTWFFIAYERNWSVTPSTIYSNTLPHPSLLAGDFSLLNDSAKPKVPGGVMLTAQNNCHRHRRLTLNLRMRYELITPFIDANDLIANFDPNYVNPTTGQRDRFVIPSTKTLKYLETRIINYGYVLASQSGLGVGRGLVRMDTNNIAPRAG